MTTAFGAWFIVLLTACIAAPYAFRVAPRTRRQWTFVTVAIAFIAWLLLPLMQPVRSFAPQGDKPPPSPEPGTYRVRLCETPCAGAKPESDLGTAIVVILDDATAKKDTTQKTLTAIGSLRRWMARNAVGIDNACFKASRSARRVGIANEELFFGITPQAATLWRHSAADGFSLLMFQSPDASYWLQWIEAGALKQGEGWSAAAMSQPRHRNAYFVAERIGVPDVDQCK